MLCLIHTQYVDCVNQIMNLKKNRYVINNYISIIANKNNSINAQCNVFKKYILLLF